MKVNINNCYNLSIRAKIRKIFKYALEKLGYSQEFSANVTFVTEDEIQDLNYEFRKIDKVTDVLSFPLTDELDITDYNEKYADLGDIVICSKVAKAQAISYGHSYMREVCFLSLHGLLHLLGYDHIEKEDEKEMFGLQDEILNDLKVSRE